MNLENFTRSEVLDTVLQNHPSYQGAKRVATLCNFDIVSTLAVMDGFTPSVKYAKEETKKGEFVYYKIDKINILTSEAEITYLDGSTRTRYIRWMLPATEEEFNSAKAEYEASKASEEQES